METWYQVSVDSCPAVTPHSFPSHCKEEAVALGRFGQQSLQTSCSPVPYCHSGPASFCQGATPPPAPGHTPPELVSVPGMDYSMILNPASSPPPSQDFYTCVTSVTAGGALHLVPCVPDVLKNTAYVQFKEGVDGSGDKSGQLAALLERQMEELSCDSDPSEAAMPLLPHSSD